MLAGFRPGWLGRVRVDRLQRQRVGRFGRFEKSIWRMPGGAPDLLSWQAGQCRAPSTYPFP